MQLARHLPTSDESFRQIFVLAMITVVDEIKGKAVLHQTGNGVGSTIGDARPIKTHVLVLTAVDTLFTLLEPRGALSQRLFQSARQLRAFQPGIS
ncbi:hypothetical protein MPLDJ20_130073 [Mesorhizobium plurifarium]|uniref:Uncharacterized protein n=1 Tax=Mesorhizobium plurifarium TaxID=69974 RepID=A0A090EIL5_MESPL|nr:hypothetical protein MPLDJ20_130073 [Mesorhizobium plurifarium]